MNNPSRDFEGVFAPGSLEMQLVQQLDPDRLPKHIAVIMDGNGRWAGTRMLPRVAGHKAGIEAVKSTVETSARLGIAVLTLYAFSTENWKRPKAEVNTLMELLREYLEREVETLGKHNIRFKPIGRIADLPARVSEQLCHTQEVTAGNTGMTLAVALSYSGRQELVDAVNSLLREGIEGPIGERDIESRLYTSGLPDPDLLIRTSGEMRVSNFLLWQIAYSEIYVTEMLWPDFRSVHLLEAIVDYQRRDRRFGGIAIPSLQATR